jgi:non-homologous end joining protein Ku
MALALVYASISVYNECMDAERDVVHISIRFPREVAEAMRRFAREHDRSINGEMVRAAREYIASQQKKRQREAEQR